MFLSWFPPWSLEGEEDRDDLNTAAKFLKEDALGIISQVKEDALGIISQVKEDALGTADPYRTSYREAGYEPLEHPLHVW